MREAQPACGLSNPFVRHLAVSANVGIWEMALSDVQPHTIQRVQSPAAPCLYTYILQDENPTGTHYPVRDPNSALRH